MSIFDYIQESFYSGIRDIIQKTEKELSRSLQRKIHEIKKKIMKELVAIFIIIISVALLAISGIFFLIEYINLNKTLSFLITGIMVLFIGIILKITS